MTNDSISSSAPSCCSTTCTDFTWGAVACDRLRAMAKRACPGCTAPMNAFKAGTEDAPVDGAQGHRADRRGRGRVSRPADRDGVPAVQHADAALHGSVEEPGRRRRARPLSQLRRRVVRLRRARDRHRPQRHQVECGTCKVTDLAARDVHTVTRQAPARPPEDVSFVCRFCNERKPFATAQPTPNGTECSDCYAKHGSPVVSAEEQERASTFSSCARPAMGHFEKRV